MVLSNNLRAGIGLIVAPWMAALIVALILALSLDAGFSYELFGSYLLWLGFGGQVLSLVICAPAYFLARALTTLTFEKVVFGSALLVGGSVAIFSLLAASPGMRASGDFGSDLLVGLGAFAAMGALGGAVFWRIAFNRVESGAT